MDAGELDAGTVDGAAVDGASVDGASVDGAVVDGAVLDAASGADAAVDAMPTPIDAAPTGPPGLALVSARDHIEGAFTTRRTVAADATRIYLASRWDGTLFVLARDRAANFPVLQTIPINTPSLNSVYTDATRVYALTLTGELHVFRKGPSLTFENVRVLTPGETVHGDGAWADGSVFVSRSTGNVGANATHVWLSQLNESDTADAFSLADFAHQRHYQATFDRNVIYRFDRATGAAAGTMVPPRTLFGDLGAPSIHVERGLVGVFIAGCCGRGVELWDATSLQRRHTVDRLWANAIAWSGGYLVIGGEEGAVDLWDLSGDSPLRVAHLNLREATGHTGRADIEIRALWVDANDRFIFAASSWGNAESRGPELPSFFVLERTGGDLAAAP